MSRKMDNTVLTQLRVCNCFTARVKIKCLHGVASASSIQNTSRLASTKGKTRQVTEGIRRIDGLSSLFEIICKKPVAHRGAGSAKRPLHSRIISIEDRICENRDAFGGRLTAR